MKGNDWNKKFTEMSDNLVLIKKKKKTINLIKKRNDRRVHFQLPE